MKRRTITTPAMRRRTFMTPAVRSRRISVPLPERRRRRGRGGLFALLGLGALLAALLAIPAAIRAAVDWVAAGIRLRSLDSE